MRVGRVLQVSGVQGLARGCGAGGRPTPPGAGSRARGGRTRLQRHVPGKDGMFRRAGTDARTLRCGEPSPSQPPAGDGRGAEESGSEGAGAGRSRAHGRRGRAESCEPWKRTDGSQLDKESGKVHVNNTSKARLRTCCPENVQSKTQA